jgi:hypothetical protein
MGTSPTKLGEVAERSEVGGGVSRIERRKRNRGLAPWLEDADEVDIDDVPEPLARRFRLAAAHARTIDQDVELRHLGRQAPGRRVVQPIRERTGV